MSYQSRLETITAQDLTARCAASGYSGANRRAALRKAMCVPGLLLIPDQHDPVSCKVVDFSATGARVQLAADKIQANWNPTGLPGDLILVMRMDRTEVSCKAVWQRESQMGLQFRSALRHT